MDEEETFKVYIQEQDKQRKTNKLKRILTYRILSISSDFIIVIIVTGKWEIGLITTPLCIITHTLLHFFVEKIFK